MYSIIRKIHLYSAFVVASFLLMYFLTGAMIITEDIFPRMRAETVTGKIATRNDQTEGQTVDEICKQYDIHGEKTRGEGTNGNTNYSFFRPGYRAELVFAGGGDSVAIKINQGTFGSVMSDFHRLRGYKGSWTHWLWALLYDLSCIALLVFAISGAYLWWKLETEKLAGVLFLFVSTGITVFTIWYMLSVC